VAALDAAAAKAGLRRTEWLLACARRRLSAKPQFSEPESVALLETRRELRRIGVNLRELARKIADQDGTAPEDLAALHAFQDEVRAQLEGVRAAIDGNLAFWGGEA
jgi:DNA-binding transcriptional MerR regulator